MELLYGEKMVDEYQAFVDRLIKSREALWVVAKWIGDGTSAIPSRDVIVPGYKIMPRGADPTPYIDDGDLFVIDPVRGKLMIEVRRIFRKFTCLEDWKFPKVVVAQQDTVERRWGQVEAYVITNEDMTHAIVIKGDTKDKWWKEELLARTRTSVRNFYVCKNEDVTFHKITGN